MTIINLKEILSSLFAPFLFVVKCNSVLAALKVKGESECCIHEAILYFLAVSALVLVVAI